ncbi:hypothetical protein B0H10DRAFT_1965803 [Mycena sp. CBHHK59/15]|nr:hypothetical protein B0H10DRAFT_1965803 [Mycena sp. CBHHK59/15]
MSQEAEEDPVEPVSPGKVARVVAARDRGWCKKTMPIFLPVFRVGSAVKAAKAAQRVGKRAPNGYSLRSRSYDLSADIASFLAREGFRTVKALSLVDTYTLEDAGLRKDHIAELKMALAKLLDDYDIGPE